MPDDHTANGISPRPPAGEGPEASAAQTSPRPLAGEGPGVRAAGHRTGPNPYVQVALTYLRRPLASLIGRIFSVAVVLLLIMLFLARRPVNRPGFGPPDLIPFLFLFGYLATHAKGQFADPRAHLMPGFRRVHATVAAVLALVVAVILPAMLTHVQGWHSIGFLATVVLLFGTVLWVAVKNATWTGFGMVAVWLAFFITEPGQACVAGFMSGHFEPLALAFLGLGSLITLLAGMQLIRLNEDMPAYYTRMRWDDWDWNRKSGQGWSDRGRLLPGLSDWISERQMARLTRLARRAPASWWSRTCRWQAGMVAGWSFWFWILGTLIYVHAISALIAPPIAPLPMIGVTALVLNFVPAIASVGMFNLRAFKLGHEASLPVARKSYLRQLGAAAALNHCQLWGGVAVALVLWWLLVGPRPFPRAMLASVLALSAAFQVGVFGVLVWTARYRSRIFGVLGLMALVLAIQLFHMWWSMLLPGPLPYKVECLAAIMTLLGLLMIGDAYRRWLVTDFD